MELLEQIKENAKKQCKTFEEAVDLCCEALRKQLIKWKEKISVK